MISNRVKKTILKIIKIYQKSMSPYLGKNCRFYPSCSEYIYQTIERRGIFSGFQKGVWRLLRCNPFNKGGIDLP